MYYSLTDIVRLGNCKKIKSVNAEDDKIFILKNIFNKLNIHPESVLINFCRFDDIDEMKLDDLNNLNSATHIVRNKFKILSNNILPSILPCQKIHLT